MSADYFTSNILEYVKPEYREKIEKGAALKSEFLKIERKPEEVTKQVFLKFLREEFGIEESREEGEGFTTEVKVVFKERAAKPRRYPDVLIWFNKKARLDNPWAEFDGVLLEIEPYGAKLDAKGAGINQVKEWLSYTPIGSAFVGIATNLRGWWVVYFDNTTKDFIEHKFTTEAFIDWLTHILGRGGKSFSGEFREKQAEVITDRFYDHYYAILFGGEFRNREGKKVSIRKEDSLVGNIYPKDLPERAILEEDKIEYARLFLTRMMFIKILMDRGIIRDDLFEVLRSRGKEELPLHIEQLFFRVFNTQPRRRRGVLHEFKDLPYLNGGLFAYQNIGDRGISEIRFGIPAEQIEMVMEFLEQYSFTREEADVAGAISPEILGYVFEKTISNRKETGAYYTPRKITRYIAEETIKGYLLDIINEKLRERGWETVDSVEEFLEGGYDPKLVKTVFEELKNIRILDPAVGSGAFLLAAGEVILELHKKFLRALHKEDKFDPYEIKRHIVQHNLFGVDINRSAVEIAKLRLWLWIMEDVTEPEDVKPLPNIDYNLLAGNSLIGYLDDIPKQTTQLAILKDRIADKLQQLNIAYPNVYRIIEERLNARTTATLKELIELRKMLIEEYYSERDPLAQSLLKPIIDDISKAIREQFDGNYFRYLKRELKGKLKKEELEAQHPLHWALEFPEVFLNGKGGFDIVIGNPPYVRQEELKEQKKFFRVEYKEIYNSTNDLSVYFVEKSLKLVHEGGYHSFIITNKWTRTGYGKKLRNWLRDNFRILQILNFDDMEVFKEVGKQYATTYVLVYIIKKEKPPEDNEFIFVPVNTITKSIDEISDLRGIVSAYGYKAIQKNLDEKAWSFGNKTEEEIKQWIEKVGIPLTDLDVTIYFGIKTGDNKAFVVDDETKKKLIKENPESIGFFKSVLRGKDIGRYYYRWKKTWLLTIPAGFTKELAKKTTLREQEASEIFGKHYPAIYNYLKEIGEKELEKQKDKKKKRGLFDRDDQGDFWWELRPCDYYEEFEKPKILWARITANEPKFVWDVNKMYTIATIFMAVGSDVSKALLLIWNSKLSWFTMSLYSTSLKGNTREYIKAYLKKLPIALPDPTERWIYETIADYLLFLNSDDELKEKHQKELQFLDELGNLLVLELYFQDKFQKGGVYRGLPLLQDIVKKYLQPIEYDEYAKLHYSIEPLDVQQSARLSQLKDQNLKTIRSVVAKLLRDPDIPNLMGRMKTHDWSKTILSV